MSLVLDRAKELAKALSECDEYVSYRKALDELENHEAAKVMWSDFRRKQTEIQAQQLAGEEVDKAKLDDLQRSYGIITMNPYVRDVLAAEFRFSHLFADVQRIIGEAVGLKYGDDEEDSGSGGGSDDAGLGSKDRGENKPKEKSRIIVP